MDVAAGVLAPILLLAVLVALLAGVLVFAMMLYAQRRGLLDHPGQRRLHRLPTPRGGGAGAVLALALGLLLLQLLPGAALPWRWTGMWLPALLLTALVGALDDHRGLGIGPRLAAHLAAGALLALSLWPQLSPALQPPLALLLAAALVLATAWSINLHNFMDGSDGLLAMQVFTLALVFAWMAARSDQLPLLALALLLAAALAGFLPFNLPLPRAHVFMGDVGSGAFGFMLAALAFAGVARGAWSLPAALLLVSAFAVDAGATLLSRMLRGRRWWRPHREHFYQWLARTRHSHAQALLAYLGWNLLLAIPLALWAQRDAALGWWLVIGLYMLAGAAWWQGKRACRRAPRRHGNRHAPV